MVTRKIKKDELIEIIQRIFNITEYREDPYASTDDVVIQIHDLCAEVLGIEMKKWYR
jgi:hypothetical protein